MSTRLNHARACAGLAASFAAIMAMLLGGCGGATVVGRKIEFGQGGDSEKYRTSGWSHTEEKFTWTEGNSAKLSFPVGNEAGPLQLNILMGAFTHPPDLPTQPVEVFVNGQKLAEWQVGGDAAGYNVPIPADTVKRGSKLEVEFRIPKAMSPKSVGLGEDSRVLGICLLSLELAKA